MAGYISEVQYEGGGGDFIEVVVPAGTDTSSYSLVIYDNKGEVQATLSLGTVDVTFVGNDGYVVDETDPSFVDLRDNSAIALVDDTGNVLQFLGFKQAVTAVEGPANGQTSDTTGDISSTDTSVQTTDGGATYSDGATNAGTIPCFTPGTLILTPTGEVAVGDLKVGDLVVTSDHGNQPIRYLARSEVSGPDIPQNRQPILISRGSLGAGLPNRDLVVSGQHRMLLAWEEVQNLHNEKEVLAPAKGLVSLPRVRVKKGVRHVEYIHLLLDRHEVIFAEGAPTESFYPGPTMLRDMSERDRQALFKAVPDLRHGVEAALGRPARKLLRVRETKTLARRSVAAKKDETPKWDADLAMERHETRRLASSGARASLLDRSAA